MAKRKVWLALGTAVLVAAPVVESALAQTAVRRGPVLLAQGGEGGERGRAASSAEDADLPANLRLLRDLHLVRGHLQIADELVQQGRWAAAIPHHRHAEEIHRGMRRELQAHGVAPFASTLKDLAQAAKARNKRAHDAADANIRSEESNWPALVVEAVLELLRSAAGEYDEAIKNGRIVRPTEYQDARGIALEAERLLASAAEPLTTKDADAVRAAGAAFADLHKAWPSPVPPRTALADTSEVISHMSRIELQIGRFR